MIQINISLGKEPYFIGSKTTAILGCGLANCRPYVCRAAPPPLPSVPRIPMDDLGGRGTSNVEHDPQPALVLPGLSPRLLECSSTEDDHH